MIRQSQSLIMCLIAAAILAGCGTPRAYFNEEADFGFYERVAVIPFSNLSNDPNASEKLTAAFTTELLIGKEVQVANAGNVWKSVRTIIKDERRNLTEQISSDEATAIGTAAEVQGIFVGSVKDFGMVRSGSEEFPLVSISIRFIDCQTGNVAWSYEITRKGGPKFPIFSFGETHTLGEMTAKVCRSAVGSFLGAVK